MMMKKMKIKTRRRGARMLNELDLSISHVLFIVPSPPGLCLGSAQV